MPRRTIAVIAFVLMASSNNASAIKNGLRIRYQIVSANGVLLSCSNPWDEFITNFIRRSSFSPLEDYTF